MLYVIMTSFREFFEAETQGDKTPEYTSTPTRNCGNTPPFDKGNEKTHW